jgi:hypothetical protein
VRRPSIFPRQISPSPSLDTRRPFPFVQDMSPIHLPPPQPSSIFLYDSNLLPGGPSQSPSSEGPFRSIYLLSAETLHVDPTQPSSIILCRWPSSIVNGQLCCTESKQSRRGSYCLMGRRKQELILKPLWISSSNSIWTIFKSRLNWYLAQYNTKPSNINIQTKPSSDLEPLLTWTTLYLHYTPILTF